MCCSMTLADVRGIVERIECHTNILVPTKDCVVSLWMVIYVDMWRVDILRDVQLTVSAH